MKKKKEKVKVKYIDDGHTVYSMDGLSPNAGRSDKKDEVRLSRAEKKAAIKAAFSVYFPILMLVLICFSLTMLLMHFWLLS